MNYLLINSTSIESGVKEVKKGVIEKDILTKKNGRKITKKIFYDIMLNSESKLHQVKSQGNPVRIPKGASVDNTLFRILAENCSEDDFDYEEDEYELLL